VVSRPSGWGPDRGDIIWLDFAPQAGRKQKGRRPALVLSPRSYNAKVGLAVCCPITSRVKGYPFEVVLPAGLRIRGAVLSDHLKNLDWRARNAELAARAPKKLLEEVFHRLEALLFQR
jgi:mRNA interferase MazF